MWVTVVVLWGSIPQRRAVFARARMTSLAGGGVGSIGLLREIVHQESLFIVGEVRIVKMPDRSEDAFERAYEMYEGARDAVLGSEAYRRFCKVASSASKTATNAAYTAGNTAWVIGTALVIGLLPALFAIDRELNPPPTGPGGAPPSDFAMMETPPTDSVSDAATPSK